MKKETYLTALVVVLVILLVITNVYWIVTRPEPAVRKLNFAYQVGFHYGANIILDYLDLIENKSHGRLQANFFKISGGSTINEAIVAGSIDFAQMGTAPAIVGVDQGIGTRILASIGSKEHELWTWRPDVQSIADFEEGDVVCVVKVNSIEHVGLIKAYKDLGRTKDNADAISGFFSHSDAFQMMEEGTVDADFTGVPYTLLYAEKTERYHKIANDTSIWGLPLAGGVLIGRASLEAETIDMVLESFIEAIEWIENNPEEASRIIGEVYDYEENEAWELWQELGVTWGPAIGLDALETQAGVMYDLGTISQELTTEQLLFPQAIELIEG